MKCHASLTICIVLTLLVDVVRAGLLDGPYDNSQNAWIVFAPVGGGVFLFLFIVGVIAAIIPRHKCGFLRAFSFAFWILFWLTAIFGGACSAVTTCREYSKEVDLLRWICLFSLPLWWIYMLIESGLCRERWIISYLQHARDLDGYLEMLRQVRPNITWYAESYHYLSVRSGRSHPRVLTNTDTEEFNYKYCLDDSDKKLRGLRYQGVTIIKLRKEIILGDAETARAMDDAERSPKERNRGNDLHIKVAEVRDIPGFKRRIGAYFNKGCFIGQLQFWIAVFFAFTWPYRWIFSSLTTKTLFTVRKKVYLCKPETDGASVVNLTNEHPPTKENGFPMYSGRYDAKQLPLPPPYEMDQFSPMPVHYDMDPPFMKKDKYMSSGYPEYLHSTGPSPLEDTGKGFSQNPVLSKPRLSPNTPWPPASYVRGGFGYNPTGEPPFRNSLPASLSVISPSAYY